LRKINAAALLGYYIFFLFAVLLLLAGFATPVMENHRVILAGVIAFCPAAYYLNSTITGAMLHLSDKKRLFLLLCVCFTVKLSWVFIFRIRPETDYKMFFDTASDLSRRLVIDNRYVALFPHIMGYALFLSAFFSVFGVHYLLPPVINAVLSVMSMALLYDICRRLFGRETAVTAALLWTAFPSQTIFNMMALSEPLYCTLLLAIWALLVFFYTKRAPLTAGRIVLMALAQSALLVLFNMTRPLAVVQIAAFTAWLLFVDRAPARKDAGREKVVFLALTLAFYGVFSLAANQYITLRLGEKPAGLPGYSLYVGFNADSRGAYNERDARLLSSYNSRAGWSADRVQRQMYRDALEKLKSGGINYPRLFYDKYLVLLGDDSSAVYYAQSVLRHSRHLATASNIFYFSAVVFALIGAVRAMRTNDTSPLFMVCLFAVGLILAQLLVEVAGRYHYAVAVSFLIPAAFGLNGSSKQKADF
jgi:4-amino-4-deoxy-L-arabinose transferase-like glycosyltransferase